MGRIWVFYFSFLQLYYNKGGTRNKQRKQLCTLSTTNRSTTTTKNETKSNTLSLMFVVIIALLNITACLYNLLDSLCVETELLYSKEICFIYWNSHPRFLAFSCINDDWFLLHWKLICYPNMCCLFQLLLPKILKVSVIKLRYRLRTNLSKSLSFAYSTFLVRSSTFLVRSSTFLVPF